MAGSAKKHSQSDALDRNRVQAVSDRCMDEANEHSDVANAQSGT
jgi:hypothetical protein